MLLDRQALVGACALSLVALGGLVGGVRLLKSAMACFDVVGGTIAPDDPPQVLVVTGPFAYVRNPMAIAQLIILLSEGVLVGLPKLLALAGVYAAFLVIYTPCSEEPGLRARFGADWVYYYYAVGAWLPRCSPWEPGREQV